MDGTVRFLISALLVCFLVSSTTLVAGDQSPTRQNFFSFGRKPDVAPFVVSVGGFKQICRSFNESLSCIRTHLKRCGSPLHPILFDLFTGEMQYLFNQFMCTENKQRKVFFEHGLCLRENVFATDRAIPCLNNYLLAFEHVQEAGSRLPMVLDDHPNSSSPSSPSNSSASASFSPTDWIRSICCAHQLKRQCTDKLARESCGPEAATAFDLFFEQIHFGFFTILCRPATAYDPESASCRAALPNRGQKPKGLRSGSAVSQLLVSYFPFNYVTVAKRKQIFDVYSRRLESEKSMGKPGENLVG
ncbi:hypothetical protein TYRP_016577 [Tyrophagus putrescentiae]|nr:hypothetical protein TYRP_016577 [Tyrophagus putrescentiae]